MTSRKRRFDGVSGTLTNFLGKPTKWVCVSLFASLVVFPLYWLFTSAIKYEADYLASPPVLVPTRATRKILSPFSPRMEWAGGYTTRWWSRWWQRHWPCCSAAWLPTPSPGGPGA